MHWSLRFPRLPTWPRKMSLALQYLLLLPHLAKAFPKLLVAKGRRGKGLVKKMPNPEVDPPRGILGVAMARAQEELEVLDQGRVVDIQGSLARSFRRLVKASRFASVMQKVNLESVPNHARTAELTAVSTALDLTRMFNVPTHRAVSPEKGTTSDRRWKIKRTEPQRKG